MVQMGECIATPPSATYTCDCYSPKYKGLNCTDVSGMLPPWQERAILAAFYQEYGGGTWTEPGSNVKRQAWDLSLMPCRQPQPSPPASPTAPVTPSVPNMPSSPSVPAMPAAPLPPVAPTAPTAPAAPAAPTAPAMPTMPSTSPVAPTAGTPSVPTAAGAPTAAAPVPLGCPTPGTCWESNYDGVVCDLTTGEVIGIGLPDSNLKGDIAAANGMVTLLSIPTLQMVDLSFNEGISVSFLYCGFFVILLALAL